MLNEQTLAEIVTRHPMAAAVFEKHHLDYCCKGERTLQEACNNDAALIHIVVSEVERLTRFKGGFGEQPVFDRITLTELVRYIVGKHHHYIRSAMPLLDAHLRKVTGKHGERHPELLRILQLFVEVKEDLEQHLFKEERILFPRIVEIEQAAVSGSLHWIPERNYIAAPIHVMEAEHDEAGGALDEIRRISHGYEPPADACTTYRLVYQELKEFEQDLHRHVHLENNLLFPKAVALQQQFGKVNLN
jgi:regulator of cell morphogenesis and NO signaling